jgi:hypothetical protein
VATDEAAKTDEELRLLAEIRDRQDRVAAIRLRRSHPAVIPVQVFWRKYRLFEEPYLYADEAEWDLILAAYRDLVYSEDGGSCSPVGVKLDGTLIEWDELHRRYPQVWEELMGR